MTGAGEGAGDSDPLRAASAKIRIDHWPWALRPLAIFAISRIITLVTIAVSASLSNTTISNEINRWDTKWFLRAAQFGWPSHLPRANGHVLGNTTAFFPLFPLTIRWLSDLSGLSLLVSGIVITTLSGAVAMIGVWALVRHYAGSTKADRATLLVALFPGSFVLSLVYSEGLIVGFIAFGILALLRRQWLLAGVLGLLATATSPIALAFEVSCLWCAYQEVAKHRNWRVLWAPILTPFGFVAYQTWLWVHTSNALAWRITERDGWQSYPSLAYPVHIIVTFVRDPVAVTQTGDLLFAGVVLCVVAAVIALRSDMPKPMLLYGLAAAVLAFVAAPVGLRPRFLFLAFPLIAAVATWLHGWSYLAVLSISVILLVLLTAYEVTSFAIFP